MVSTPINSVAVCNTALLFKNPISEEAENATTESLTNRIATCVENKLSVNAAHVPEKNEFTTPLQSKSSLSKQEDIQLKSGKIWICKDRIIDPETNEFSYIFEIDNLYNSLFTKNANEYYEHKKEEIFPALELDAKSLSYIDPSYLNERMVTGKFNEIDFKKEMKYCQNLNNLGFKLFKGKDGSFTLHLPSRESLLARCQKLGTDYPSLLKLTIESSEGIADDHQYINTLLTHDVLVSEGEEFVHDQILHMIPTLSQMLKDTENTLSSQTFAGKRAEHKLQIDSAYSDMLFIKNLIQQKKYVPDQIKTSLPIMVAGISAAVDLLSATFYAKVDDVFVYLRGDLWEDPNWQRYFTKRFPNEKIDFSSLHVIWQQTLDFAQQARNDLAKETKMAVDCKNESEKFK
jgi:hypothetical protein